MNLSCFSSRARATLHPLGSRRVLEVRVVHWERRPEETFELDNRSFVAAVVDTGLVEYSTADETADTVDGAVSIASAKAVVGNAFEKMKKKKEDALRKMVSAETSCETLLVLGSQTTKLMKAVQTGGSESLEAEMASFPLAKSEKLKKFKKTKKKVG